MYLEVGVTLYYPMIQARVHLLSKVTVEVLTLFSLAVIFLVSNSYLTNKRVIENLVSFNLGNFECF